MMEGDSEQLVPKPEGKKTRFSTWFAIIFILGFGVALLAMTGMQWKKDCDQPLKVYLLLHGFAGLAASLFFLAVEATYMESKDPADDGSLKGRNLQLFFVLLGYFFITGVVGSAWFFSSNCEDTAFTTHRWAWAAVLLFLIMASMMFSDTFGKLGAPFFAKVGHLFGSIFQMLADAFNTIADVLEEGPADPENVPPKRSAAAVFAIYVNHAAFLWFFLYIYFEAWKERKLECDKPLKTYLYGFSVLGALVTYAHFLFELFAGVHTKAKLAKRKHVFMSILLLIVVIWGFVGFHWVRTSSTCEEDGNAVNTYRLAYLLSCCFLAFFCVMGLFGCMGVLDFLCSGRMRFVVVISSGEEEDEEVQS